jgi:hypothetical protein
MKTCRLPKREFEIARANRKSNLSCHKKKQGEKIYLPGSRDEDDSIVCGCCKKIFFTKDEFRRLLRAEKTLRSIEDQLEKMNEENRRIINNIYDSSSVSIIDLYTRNPEAYQDIVTSERKRIDALIRESIAEKNNKQEQLKRSVNYTNEDDELITRMYHIESNCVTNCCYDCNFRWYCEKCCFTYKFKMVYKYYEHKTCGITLMSRLLNINNKSGKYGSLADSDIYLLQERFKNDMKYGIHPDTLRGKSVDIEELRTEQRRKIEELRDEQKRKIRKIEKVNVTA